MKIPHQTYRYTVGRLPDHVQPDKPCWPWLDSYEDDEELPEAGPERLSMWHRLLIHVASWFA